jgi:glucan 1,3-beta-glucosidase
VIESFDAPWKRVFEGTVGGHWGLFDDATRVLKFDWGAAVSNHPAWRWQGAGGIAFAALVFAAALFAGRGKSLSWPVWLAVSANALAGGVLIGWAVENVPLESLGAGMWSRSLALVAVAFISPLIATAAIMRQIPMPRMSTVLNRQWRQTDLVAVAAGIVLVATFVLAIQVALGLVFDPRYKDFPFAPFTAAIVPLLTHSLAVKRYAGARGAAEIAGAVLLALCVVYILPNETLANWQSLWLCAAFAGLALTMLRVRAAPD